MNSPITVEPFEITTGRVVWVGIMPPKPAAPVSVQIDKLQIYHDSGVGYDRHAGPRLLDARDEVLIAHGHRKGTPTCNMRQWSALAREDIESMEAEMDVPDIEYGDLGPNLVVEGIPRFSLLPPGTQILFKRSNVLQSPVLLVHGINEPCEVPAQNIATRRGEPKNSLVAKFKSAAEGRRGLVGWVMCSGVIKPGDSIIAALPRQILYHPPTI